MFLRIPDFRWGPRWRMRRRFCKHVLARDGSVDHLLRADDGDDDGCLEHFLLLQLNYNPYI